MRTYKYVLQITTELIWNVLQVAEQAFRRLNASGTLALLHVRPTVLARRRRQNSPLLAGLLFLEDVSIEKMSHEFSVGAMLIPMSQLYKDACAGKGLA